MLRKRITLRVIFFGFDLIKFENYMIFSLSSANLPSFRITETGIKFLWPAGTIVRPTVPPILPFIHSLTLSCKAIKQNT